MGTNVRVWTGSGSMSLTDMTNAGKRGKNCKTLRIYGYDSTYCHTPEEKEAAQITLDIHFMLCRACGVEINSYHHEMSTNTPFEEVRQAVISLVNRKAFGLVKLYDEEIKGIKAPRPKLTAGKEGVWAGSADVSGISLSALNDPYNDWTEITSRQTGPRAYEIACRVWDKVREAKTVHEAGDILRAAGAKLHGYCAVD